MDELRKEKITLKNFINYLTRKTSSFPEDNIIVAISLLEDVYNQKIRQMMVELRKELI